MQHDQELKKICSCGRTGTLKKFHTFEYYYCTYCKVEIKDKPKEEVKDDKSPYNEWPNDWDGIGLTYTSNMDTLRYSTHDSMYKTVVKKGIKHGLC